MHSTIGKKSKPKSVKPRELVPENLRVLVVSDAIIGRNGVGTYYADLVDHLRDRVEQVAIIAPRSTSERVNDEIEWFSSPMPGDSTQRLAFPKPSRFRAALVSMDPHVVILPTLGAYTYFGARAARRSNIPICTSHHTNFEKLVDIYWSAAFSSAAQWALRRLSGWVLRQAKVVTAMNYESLEDAKNWGAKRTRMVGTPLAKQFLDRPYGHRETPPKRVIYIGRLSPEKRVDLFIEAAESLPGYRFTVAGDGPLRADVEAASARLSNLQYRGWVDRQGVLELLDESDVLVLPSTVETFGTVALEALARQRYVIVSRNCGISDWPNLAQGLFTMDENESLATVLSRMSHMSAQRRDDIAMRGWEAVRQFNEDSIQMWLDVLCEVAWDVAPGNREDANSRRALV